MLRAVPLRVGGPICITGAATEYGHLGQIDAVPGFWRWSRARGGGDNRAL